VEDLSTPAGPARRLVSLARELGVQTAYRDVSGRRRDASREALEAVIAALTGQDVTQPESMLARLRAERAARLLEPAYVAWLPGQPAIELPDAWRGKHLQAHLESEDGAVRGWRVDASDSPLLRLPELKPGYYRLHISGGRRRASATIIASPRRAYRDPAAGRAWGGFLPLYALQSARSWGAGDFTDMREFAAWLRSMGASAAGTLPFLACFLDGPLFEPSPYAPVSRLMWNEAFVDVTQAPGFQASDAARALVASPAFQRDIDALRTERLVDYPRLAALKRRALTAAAAGLTPAQRGHLKAFLEREPHVAAYAAFRARTERYGPWQSWPARVPDFDPATADYHAFAQWAAHRQVEALATGPGAGLYLDLPLGVHASGFDTWRWPESFVHGASAGAPPDPFFEGGQDWGFPPLHPSRIRERGYEYVIAYLRHNLRFASRLRIDHVMGLHRLYFVPAGFPAAEGVYVRFPAEELYAVFCLESHRQETEIVGENLGTVPGYVNVWLRRHGFSGMYIVPFEVDYASGRLKTPPEDSVAALNTHDLPTFAAWWRSLDANDPAREAVLRTLRESHDLISESNAGETAAVCRGLLRFLADGPARLALVNIEDLWGEPERQNMPGTTWEHPNWRRKARLSLEEMKASAEVRATLADLARRRLTTP
jgi:4-alpha-glucanotransferase